MQKTTRGSEYNALKEAAQFLEKIVEKGISIINNFTSSWFGFNLFTPSAPIIHHDIHPTNVAETQFGFGDTKLDADDLDAQSIWSDDSGEYSNPETRDNVSQVNFLGNGSHEGDTEASEKYTISLEQNGPVVVADEILTSDPFMINALSTNKLATISAEMNLLPAEAMAEFMAYADAMDLASVATKPYFVEPDNAPSEYDWDDGDGDESHQTFSDLTGRCGAEIQWDACDSLFAGTAC